MKLEKKFAFWLPIVYVFLAMLSSGDETLIIFMIISPPAWFYESGLYWQFIGIDLHVFVIFLITVVFWLSLGWLIDYMIKWRKASAYRREQ